MPESPSRNTSFPPQSKNVGESLYLSVEKVTEDKLPFGEAEVLGLKDGVVGIAENDNLQEGSTGRRAEEGRGRKAGYPWRQGDRRHCLRYGRKQVKEHYQRRIN